MHTDKYLSEIWPLRPHFRHVIASSILDHRVVLIRSANTGWLYILPIGAVHSGGHADPQGHVGLANPGCLVLDGFVPGNSVDCCISIELIFRLFLA